MGSISRPGFLCDEEICDSPLHVRAVFRAELESIRELSMQRADDSYVHGHDARLTCYQDLGSKDITLSAARFLTDLAELTAEVDAILAVGYVYLEGHLWIDRLHRKGEPLTFCDHPLAVTSWRPATPEEVQAAQS